VDLDWFWRGWFYTTDHVDISIDKVWRLRLDTEEIFSLIKDHYHATESTKALSLLENWEESKTSFVKVMPTEYKRALKRLAEEQNIKQTV